MNTGLSVMLAVALSGLATSVTHAQYGGASSSTASPYIQQRSQSYTSYDNPYAPGGIYDPYRGNHSTNSTLKSSHQPKAKTAMDASTFSQKASAGSGLNGGGGQLSRSSAQCGSSGLGDSGATSGTAMNRLQSGTAGGRSSLGKCGNGSDYKRAYSAGTTSTMGLNSQQGMNGRGQTAGTQLQR